MVKGTTSTGFKYSANEKVNNDWRFVKALNDVESKDESRIINGTVMMVNLLLGSDGETKLCKHVAEPDGTIPTDKLMAEVGEILKGLKGKVKNS